MNVYRLISTLVIIATLALAGCGGGGSSSPMAGMPDNQQPPAQQPGSGATPSVSVFGGLNVDQMAADNILAAMGKAAEATPRAGSVTQSSNVNSNNVTLDRVEVTAEYGASQHRFSVRNGTEWSIGMGEGNPQRISDVSPPWKGSELSKRVSGGTVYVDAHSDIEAPKTSQISTGGGQPVRLEDIPQGSRVGGMTQAEWNARMGDGTLNGVPGTFSCDRAGGGSCPSFGGTAFDPSGTDWIFTPQGTTTTVSEADTDYLSGGVWVFVPDTATSVDDLVFGAFADGSDPFAQANLVTLQGTATYEGNAVGVYSEKTATATNIGDFAGVLELTANFGGGSDFGTISGSITEFLVDGAPADGTLNLGTANIGSQNSGFFHGAVTGSNNTRSYTGNWGGQFFGNGESDGRPGSVAGTFGGSSTDDAVNFVGAFGAYKQ